MKKIYLIALLYILFPYFLIAQSKQIALDKLIADTLYNTMNIGVYMSHQDFMDNKPMYTNIEIKVRSELAKAYYGKNTKLVMVFNEETKKMNRINLFWGAFNGNKLYLLQKKLIYEFSYLGRYNVCRAEKINRNTPFIQIRSNRTFNNSFPAFGGKKTIEKTKIFDLKTDKWYNYSVSGMKKLLQDNSKFYYRQFMSETGKRRKFHLYLAKMNGAKNE